MEMQTSCSLQWDTVTIVVHGEHTAHTTDSLRQLLTVRLCATKHYMALVANDNINVYINDKIHKRIPFTEDVNILHFLDSNTLLTAARHGKTKLCSVKEETFTEYDKSRCIFAHKKYVLGLITNVPLLYCDNILDRIHIDMMPVGTGLYQDTLKLKSISDIHFISSHSDPTTEGEINLWDYATMRRRLFFTVKHRVIDLEYLDKMSIVFATIDSVKVWTKFSKKEKFAQSFDKVFSLNKIDKDRILIQYEEEGLVKVAVWKLRPLEREKTLCILNFAGLVSVTESAIVIAGKNITVYDVGTLTKIRTIREDYETPSSITISKF